MNFRDKYEYSYTESINQKLKRVNLNFDYYNEQHLDAMLKAIKDLLIEGNEKIDKTVMYGAKSYVVYGRQDYKSKRPVDIIDHHGIKYYVIKSRI